MKNIDFVLLVVVVMLSFFGLFMIHNASSIIALSDFNDKYYYVKEQAVWMVLGFAALGFFTFFPYKRFYTFAIPILITAIVLLVMVLIPGLGIRSFGARSWINFHFFVLQPAEFVKLALAIYLAAWFSHREEGRLHSFLLLMGTVLGLIMLQPDLGTASIIAFQALIIYFLSGGAVRHFLMLLPVIGVAGLIAVLVAPYRLARITSFLNVGSDLSNSSYHVKQILIALGSGGVLGLGLGNSLQKYAYLPENVTDSIFAIIAEEVGFFGSLIVILLLAVVVWRGFVIASRAKDNFGKLLAGGIISFIGIQMVVNLSGMTVLAPLTGVPLPFISYGGSALIVNLAAIGILLNISKSSHT